MSSSVTSPALGLEHAIVLSKISEERVKQIARKGFTSEHDDHLWLDDWAYFISDEVRDLQHFLRERHAPRQYEQGAELALIKIAALAVAAVESLERRKLCRKS